MAEKRRTQGPWPPKMDDQPVADFLHPDGFLRSGRQLAGPLRLGTAPGVGPSGLLRDGNASDYGMDRVSPRRFDPMGSHNIRSPERESSTLLSRDVRGRGKASD